VNKLGFTLERELEQAVGIKDESGLTIFLVGNVDSRHHELSNAGVPFVSPPRRQFGGYGAEVWDPDGYMNHLWDEVTMARAMREMSEDAEKK
jgi:glyoxalase/bleomycin resistance protein/dioxygenase superfamily protein